MVSEGYAQGFVVSNHVFSWVFLFDWVMAFMLAIFVAFFFNRFAGWLLSTILKFVLRRKYSIDIQVQAVQLSLLGGRVFFRNVSYIGSNEALAGVRGNITWRYWLPRVRTIDVMTSDDETEKHYEPARVKIKIEGAEWYVFNRSPAYDGLLKGWNDLKEDAEMNEKMGPGHSTCDMSDIGSSSTENAAEKSSDRLSRVFAEGISGILNRESTLMHEVPFLRFLPVDVEIKKGALLVGNKDTPSLMIYHFNSSRTSIDATKCPSPLDVYRMKFDLSFNEPMVELRPNMDYSDEDQDKFFTDFSQDIPDDETSRVGHIFHGLGMLILGILYLPIRLLTPRHDSSDNDNAEFGRPSHPAWHGLQRYHMHGSETSSIDRAEILNAEEEYAKASNIIDAAKLEISYYYDIPGKVPKEVIPTEENQGPDIGNSGAPPGWGMDVTFTDCTIYYGPWADRERFFIQRMLVPLTRYDSKPERQRVVGSDRLSTMFRLFIEFHGDVIIRIPTREFSKNALFAQQLKDNSEVLRSYGWIEVKAKEGSAFSFNQTMVAATSGWVNTYSMEFISPEVRSSVNHGILFTADSHLITGNIVIPHKWNGEQTWTISHESPNANLFLLREHVTLLSDMLTDFASGPPPPYELFTPAMYSLSWNFKNYKLYLNVNDKNIINNPSDLQDNIFVSFQGDLLSLDLKIPLIEIAPLKKHFDFVLTTPRFDLVVDAPPWHTAHNFSKANNIGLGRSYNFRLNGDYTFYAAANPALTDTLLLDCSSEDTTFISHGFVLKYLMQIRENYFGESVHFRTLEEFNNTTEEPPTEYTHFRTETGTDVLIYVLVNNGTIVLPANLYDGLAHVRLDFASFDTDCRFTNYYMDLQMNISPLKGYFQETADSEKILNLARDADSTRQGLDEIFIDGFVIHGNRLFGLPPTEPTYFCKWDFDMGEAVIKGPFSLASELGRIVECLSFTFSDLENSLIPDEPVLHDVTFLTFKGAGARIQFHDLDEQSTVEILTSSIDLFFNDLANERYSARVRLTVPLVKVSIMGDDDGSSKKLATFETSIALTNFIQKPDYLEQRLLQQEHIQLHDSEFKRCPFLLDKDHRYAKEYASFSKDQNLAIPVTQIAPPITRETLVFVDPNMNEGVLRVDDAEEDDLSSRASARSGVFILDPHDRTMTRGGGRRGRAASSVFDSAGGFSRESSLFGNKNDSSDQIRSGRRPETPQQAREQQIKSYGYSGSSPFAYEDNLENDYLPNAAWGTGNEDENILHADANFDFKPSSYYSENENFMPRGKLDSSAKYSNLIIQFGPVDGVLCPLVFNAAGYLIDTLDVDNPSVILDMLQVQFLEKFKLRLLAYISPEVDNFRVSIPSIHVKYEGLDHHVLAPGTENEEESHIYAEMKNLNFALRLDKTKKMTLEHLLRGEDISVVKSLYLNIESVFAGVRKGSGTSLISPMLFQIDSCEFWWHEGSNATGSLKLRNLDCFVMSDQVTWLAEFLAHNVFEVQRLDHARKAAGTVTKRQTEVKGRYGAHEKAVYLLCELVKASEKFHINDDPSVLTRPAYIIQSPKHIRASTSWKVLMRLRHILQSTPESWRQELHERIKTGQFEVPENAREIVTNSFSKWRSWELNDVAMNYLFRYLFVEHSLRDHILKVATLAHADVENISMRIQYPDDEEFVCFDYLKGMLQWMVDYGTETSNTDEQPLTVDLRVNCANIRSRITYRFIELSVKLSSIINRDKKATTDNDMGQKTSEKPGTSLPLLTLSSSLDIGSTSAELVMPSVELDCEGSKVRIGAFLEQLNRMNSSEILASVMVTAGHTRIKLRDRTADEHSPHVAQLHIGDLRLIAGVRGAILESEKMLDVSSSELAIELGNSIKKIAELSRKVKVQDLSFFEGILDTFDTNTELSSGKSSSSNNEDGIAGILSTLEDSIGPFDVRFSAKQCDIYLPLFDEMGIVLNISDTVFQCLCVNPLKNRFPDLRILMTKRKLSFALVGDEKHKRLIQLNLRRLQTIFLVSMIINSFESTGPFSFDILINVDNIDFDSASVPFVVSHILDLLRSTSISDARKAVDELLKTEENSLIRNDIGTEVSVDSDEFLWEKVSRFIGKNRVISRLSVKRSAIYLPVGDCTAIFGASNFEFEAANVAFVTEGFFKLPLYVKAKVGECSIDIESPRVDKGMSSLIRFHLESVFRDNEGVRELSIASDYLHILLTPLTLENLIVAISRSNKEFTKLFSDFQTIQEKRTSNTEPAELKTKFALISQLLESANINITLANASAAWLFGAEVENPPFPGLLIGYKKVAFTTERNQQLAINIQDIYMAPAHKGAIYVKAKDRIGPNSIVLPSIEVKTRIHGLNGEGHSHLSAPALKTKIVGKGVQVTLLPTVATIIVDTLLSFSKAMENIERTLKSTARPPQKPGNGSSDQLDPEPPIIQPFRLPVSFNVVLELGAAKIDLWGETEYKLWEKSQEAKRNSGPLAASAFTENFLESSKTDPITSSAEEVPALSLETPSITCEVSYKRSEHLSNKGVNNEQDRFSGGISIESTANKISPTAAPALSLLVKLVQKGLRRNSKLLRKKAPIEVLPSTKYQYTAEDMDVIFSRVDMNVAVRSFRQEVTFSCLPTAKIEATVAIDKSHFGIDTSNIQDRTHDENSAGRLTVLTGKVDGLKASLQHVYSRDTSGYISVDSIVSIGTRLSRLNKRGTTSPMNFAIKIGDIMLDINMKQLQELELFKDIWFGGDQLSALQSEPGTTDDSTKKKESNLVAKYNRTATRAAMPWSTDLSISNIVGKLDMGQSVGEFTFQLDRFWLSMYKLSTWEQNLSFGFDKIGLVSEGRLGVNFLVDNLHAQFGIAWRSDSDFLDALYLPLVQAVVGLDLVEAKITLDYHTFFILVIKKLNFGVSNNRNEITGMSDELYAVGDCEVINVFLTDLAASFFLDIWYTLKRLRVESNAGYNAILKEVEVSTPTSTPYGRNLHKELDPDLCEIQEDSLDKAIKRLRVILEVKLSGFNFYIFPNSFTDRDVFTLCLHNAEARFQQQSIDEMIQNSLQLAMSSFTVRLASLKKPFKQDISQLDPQRFVKHVLSSAKGGTIIMIPIFTIDMDTWQKIGTSIIEYKFASEFGGRVDVGWNLGAINFIRAMWADHARAYSSRREAYQIASDNKVLGAENIDDRLKDVELSSKYTYVALATPQISAPQLKEMGEATPPIEWIGLNRAKFPGMTHQIVIRGLQTLVQEVEVVYEEMLGYS